MQEKPYLLFAAPRSPFARRIRLILRRFEFNFEERLIDGFAPPQDFSQANPLGLVPTLITPDGLILSDSAHLIEFFNEKTNAIWPKADRARAEMRQASTLCHGLMQAAVDYHKSLRLTEVPSPRWIEDYSSQMEATLSYLAQAPSDLWSAPGGLTQAGWDLCTALEYLDFRVSDLNWRAVYPQFSSLLSTARASSFFKETQPQ